MSDFLRTRRAGLRPENVGLRAFGARRRVPGLRREELAQLAGVSVDYYVRLEQGRARNVSDEVLDAVSRALGLAEVERQYLFSLAHRDTVAHQHRPVRREQVRPGLLRLLQVADATPAYIVSHRCDVLAWNRLACALFTDFGGLPPRERNWGRLIFGNEAIRAIYDDWTIKAKETVAYLRLNVGKYPEDSELNNLIDELSVKSEEFRQWWANHHVEEKTYGRKEFDNPLVGPLTLDFETMRTSGDPGQVLVIYTAEAGSSSESRLRLLGSWRSEYSGAEASSGGHKATPAGASAGFLT